MATLTRTRTRQASSSDNSGVLLVAALAAGGAGLYLATRKPSVTPIPTPTPGGVLCDGCSSGGTSGLSGPGLYVSCSVPGNADSCTVWRVSPDATGKMVRYGYTTPTQLARCEGANPVISSTPDFGDGDTATFIGTVQDISASCPCPPGSAGA